MKTIACSFALAALVALAGCGGKQSMASRSAAAFAEAQKKGIPVTPGEHGGHAAATPAAHAEQGSMKEMSHAAMPGMDHSAMKMPGMQHEGMKSMPGMHHGAMHDMAGMDHGAMHDMAGMDHGAMSSDMAGMHHGGMQHHMPEMTHPAEVSINTEAPRSSAAMATVQPATTLQQDELDRPIQPQKKDQ